MRSTLLHVRLSPITIVLYIRVFASWQARTSAYDNCATARGDAMSVILLSGMSLADGECALARIWRALEEYCVASPRMAVATQAFGLIDIYLAFGSTEDAELVRYALPGLPPIAG